ncbi:hypothetical protein FWK35_00002912 [Aphis craccivora]|uniref:Uncharacterized protein n=1 Tax=Aphis craccivora TaxID=307492 RepID=A0A6G0ZLT3_APHCR|nr:hypothetical protein FWK35_00002912 [Aphis craccivora]
MIHTAPNVQQSDYFSNLKFGILCVSKTKTRDSNFEHLPRCIQLTGQHILKSAPSPGETLRIGTHLRDPRIILDLKVVL